MAITLCRGNEIKIEHLPRGIGKEPSYEAPPFTTEDKPLSEYLRDLERQRIAYILGLVGGKRKEAARMLGITRKSLWQKIKNLNIPS